MKKIITAVLALSLSAVCAAEQGNETPVHDQVASPWIAVAPDEPVLTMMDVPLPLVHKDPEKYRGKVFEDRFKFYHIYRDKDEADPDKRQQTISGETHFTARPMKQSVHVIRIRITPEQHAWIRNQGIRRQDVLKARVRFVEPDPGGTLAFELLEIEESQRSWLLGGTGE